MYYEGFLALHISSSNSGKSHFWKQQLAIPGRIPKERIYIFSFDGDPQYDNFETHVPVEVKSYDELDPETIPPGTFVLFDELANECLKNPKTIDKIKTIYTTRAHHFRISAVCITQGVFGLAIYQLINLSHALFIHSQQNANSQLLRLFPMYRTITKNIESFLMSLPPRPYVMCIYYNAPYKYSAINNCISLYAEPITVLYSMNPNVSGVFLKEAAEKTLRPLLALGNKEGVAIIPTDLIKFTEEKNKKGTADPSTNPQDDLEERVLQLFKNTVSPQQFAKFRKLWYFIRSNSQLSIDPETLLLSINNKHPMGLYAYISLLLKPGHLIKKGSKGSKPPEAAVELTRVLLSDLSFTPTIIPNTHLVQIAQREMKKRNEKKY